jgi:plasmid stabilization system protein ParE
MAEVIWAEPALNDLDAIADYIALEAIESRVLVGPNLKTTNQGVARSSRAGCTSLLSKSSSKFPFSGPKITAEI